MKIAVPTKNNVVDDHFGHCEYYTIFTVDANDKVVNVELLPSPQSCGCKSNIAAILKEKGVSVLLAGNMGSGALNMLSKYGIQVFRGCSGDVNELVEKYLKGEVHDSGTSCHHHEHHGEAHVCSH
ncbi:MAG: NifB/NifX family molybdenum-iron cluster-binding protein [Bacteroidales bacterium]